MQASDDLQKYKNVLVFAEHKDDEILEASIELLDDGRELANSLGEELHAVLLGGKVLKLAESLASHGVSKVYAAEHELLDEYSSDAYAGVLADLIYKSSPSTLLFAATSTASDLVPRLAARLKTGFVTDCVDLSIDNERRLVVTKPIYGDKLYCKTVFTSRSRPQILTVRPGKGVEESYESRSAEIVKLDIHVKEEDIRTKVVGLVKGDPERIPLPEAEIIVSVGRGVGSVENLQAIQELAKTIGGSIGGTRLIVDDGLLPRERLVGQTGLTVAPKLYIGCGISGAIQHLAGMKSSKNIIAINIDADAPIFKVSTLGAVGDVNKIVPAMTKFLRERQSSQNQGLKVE
jgi:electron transfer flavoprotein alpha subunit